MGFSMVEMRRLIFSLIFLFIVVFTVSGNALSDESKTKVEGDISISVKTGKIINKAKGKNAIASRCIGNVGDKAVNNIVKGNVSIVINGDIVDSSCDHLESIDDE